ncbi:MAG: protein-methionine-sulfoxide reductase catalytic subunit MsrP [Gammaproteobacteria bacterium]|nr:protein-methionine-sulfoxide reductase catalytic subunit MsrP [Gammaproteobacteria bacterium]MBU1645913.1 protein-methionine-sulfoxide reductase catalytic subunit MsrP [Gammaproteobacteria bacterium]MBU1971975.1 protein-methionine-sulfoxide reductase catalytic subunit MsrP [Gammaproteobacteria bacterium]
MMHILPSEITPAQTYFDRRKFIGAAGALALSGLLPASAAAQSLIARKSPLSVLETPTPRDDIVNYGNFLEFASDKHGHVERSKLMAVRPWTVTVEGLVAKPRRFAIEDLLKLPLEERIYRHRCVEGWSMVVPWVGFPLSALLNQVEPLGNAKYVEFISHVDPAIMPNVRRQLLDWPYLEGLRMDEALHPLTLIAVGLYGEVLPKPNGAPLRLVVPWKYGYKSAKSIVSIRLVEHPPNTVWMKAVPDEYGFYANVNPGVDHPRWSQAKERRIGEFFKRTTLPFNGYADQVASLYAGMDLRKFF